METMFQMFKGSNSYHSGTANLQESIVRKR